jgi:F420-0:gamma-glutamyl ligase
LRVTFDSTGKPAEETIVDFFANSSAVLMGQRDKGVPAVVIRGYDFKFNPDADLKTALHLTTVR